MNGGREDEGFTLIEVLITVVVMSIGVVGLIGALITASSGSSSSTETTDNRALLEAAAEQIQAATYATSPSAACATPDYSAALSSLQRPITAGGSRAAPQVAIDTVGFWDGAAFGSDCTYDRTPPAPGGDPRDDQRMQLITLRSDNERLSFVKRGP